MPTSARRSGVRQNETGLIYPMLGFLDRNLGRFSPPVRDTIGIGVLLIVVVYVLNGLIGSTYIRGKLWLDDSGRTPAAGWRVSLGEYESVTNAKGWWTLPLPGNGVPGRIRLEIADPGKDADGRSRDPMWIGEVYAFGPWPFLNTFKPMNDLVVDVYPDRPAGQRIKLASLEFVPLNSVYAQSDAPSRGIRGTLVSRTPCALALTRIKVSRFPGLFRFSGRAYMQMNQDGKAVDDRWLLYGPGIDWGTGQFPVRADKELWLPVRTGSDDRYNGLLADLTDVANCSFDSEGKVRVSPFGKTTLKMFGDQGDVLNVFDLSPALAKPNQETALTGDANGMASITVEVLAQGLGIVEFSRKGNVLTWKVTGAFSTVKIYGLFDGGSYEADSGSVSEGTYDISIDKGAFSAYALEVLDARFEVAAAKEIKVK